ncbi:hypothetical protein [Amycolatopsis jejuensis]|uniref:hypothetical protein n=1 Tax=Amycolatopsis jejuensis TaxID=330084 RepID=UPI0012E04465|nr:hypothetical protein [Amycolatopsis jejuensis]
MLAATAWADAGLTIRRERVTGVHPLAGPGAEITTDNASYTADLVVDARGGASSRGSSKHMDESCDLIYTSRFYTLTGPSPTSLEYGYGTSRSFRGWSGQVLRQGTSDFVLVIARMISEKAPFRIAGTADFDRILSKIPGIAEWCRPGTSIPLSDLSTHSGARNVLVDTSTDPDYLVRVGDSLAVTDPQLGQGASLAAWESGVLIEEISRNSPAAAAASYRRQVERVLEDRVLRSRSYSRYRSALWPGDSSRKPDDSAADARVAERLDLERDANENRDSWLRWNRSVALLDLGDDR